MAKKGKNSAKQGGDPATNIKFGTRVRHTADGVAGRIVWANAVAVKIQWDDGEKVTWKRADLTAKGLEVLGEDEGAEPVEGQAAEPQATEATTETPPAEGTPEPPAEEPAPAPAPAEEPRTIGGLPARPVLRGDGREVLVTVPPRDEDLAGSEQAIEAAAPGATTPATEPQAVPNAPKRRKRAARPAGEARPSKLSALDAAAKVLAEHGQPMGCQELIGAMAVKGYWSSPGGKTPAATLYSAILRELQTKGEKARFVKVGKGQFALRKQA